MDPENLMHIFFFLINRKNLMLIYIYIKEIISAAIIVNNIKEELKGHALIVML